MISRRLLDRKKATFTLNSLQKKKIAEYNKKIESGYYRLEHTICECGADDYDTITLVDRYGLDVQNVICKKCGLIYVPNRLSKDSFNKFYEEDYRELYSSNKIPTEAFFKDQVEHGYRIMELLEKQTGSLKKNTRVLEIGCGAGGILVPFFKKGCSVRGVDLGKEYIAYGNKIEKDLNLEVANSLSLAENGEKFDIIIMSHVLEHMLDLSDELEVVKRLMDRNAILYVEVPGIKNIHNIYYGDLLQYFQNAHVYNFSMTTLETVMKKNGLELIWGNEYISAIFKVGEKNCTVNTDYNCACQYLRKVERYRFFFRVLTIIKKSALYVKMRKIIRG